jgi:hypothetical protein
MNKKTIIIDNRVNVNGKKSTLYLENFSEVYTKDGIDSLSLTGLTGAVGPTGIQGVQGSQGIQGLDGTVGPAGLSWKGAWVSGTSYSLNDAVGFEGASYYCVIATSGTTDPVTDTTNWALLASQGANGVQGIQGVQGVQGATGTATPTYDVNTAIITTPGGAQVFNIITVLENGIGTISWTYVSTGTYLGTLAGGFPVNKTIGSITNTGINSFGSVARLSNNTISVYLVDSTGTATNSGFYGAILEIKVYN